MISRRSFIEKVIGAIAAFAAGIPLTKTLSAKESAALPVDRYTGPYPECLTIWEHPQRDAEYAIGVTTRYGMDDPMVVSVIKKGVLGKIPDMQCAEFYSTTVQHGEEYLVVLYIAAYYFSEKWRQPIVVIEHFSSPGDLCLHKLKVRGYTNFYRDTVVRRDNTEYERDGWYTTKQTKLYAEVLMRPVLKYKYLDTHSLSVKDIAEGMKSERFATCAMAFCALHC